jgi:peptidyl-prolyl cis-trans isomerase-like 4
MAVLLDTSAGELVIDLFCDECPLACRNFLKLCKIKYYNNCLFYNVQANYIVQSGETMDRFSLASLSCLTLRPNARLCLHCYPLSGDPTGTGKGGSSVYGLMYGAQAVSFQDEIHKHRKMDKVGLICMARNGDKEDSNRSQFFITMRGEDFDSLEGKCTIFGEVAEGLDVLEKLNQLYCDEEGTTA